MILKVNGESREVPDGSNVKEMLDHFKIGHKILVVELNREIVDRAAYEKTALSDGDAVEIVHFVGGG